MSGGRRIVVVIRQGLAYRERKKRIWRSMFVGIPIVVLGTGASDLLAGDFNPDCVPPAVASCTDQPDFTHCVNPDELDNQCSCWVCINESCGTKLFHLACPAEFHDSNECTDDLCVFPNDDCQHVNRPNSTVCFSPPVPDSPCAPGICEALPGQESQCVNECRVQGQPCIFNDVAGVCKDKPALVPPCVCVPSGGCKLPDRGHTDVCVVVTEEECDALGGTYLGDGTSCPIPAVSEWGLIVMALLVLTAGTIVLARWRRPAAA